MTAFDLSGATILVPVDFDAASRRAVTLAVDFARAFGGRVVLLHVIPRTSLPEGTRVLPVDAADPVDLEEYVSARARHLLDQTFATSMITGVESRAEARTGHPVDTILRAIEESDARLVVVGTHGREGSERVLHGSVAENLLRRSPVPVLIARGPQMGGAADSWPHDTAFARASIASGAVAGAVVGAIGGPAGALGGGALGTIVGAVVGRSMAKQEARAAARDRELDDAIGVTSGSLGTPPETKQPSPDILSEAWAADGRR
jgi:nucleotide-binding universal stress UspA family protein